MSELSLIENPELSYAAAEQGPLDNRLIHGDNLDALKVLASEFTGKVKCIYIDPPYNTGNSFTHYNDGVEHFSWLASMRARLEFLRGLLTVNGTLWVSIDDNEVHYLKALTDEVFGRVNFIASVVWQKVLAVKNSARHFSVDHEYVLIYARDAQVWRPNPMPGSAKQHAAYRNPDSDPRGPWQSVSFSARNPYSRGTYAVQCPGGRVINGPPQGRYWRTSEEKLWELHGVGEVWWGKDLNGVPRRKLYLADRGTLTKPPQTLWFFDDVGHTQEAKKELLAHSAEARRVFMTPKPERLIHRVLSIATSPGDLVLDGFAGSGTTGAVAHKMGRRWIMIEKGDHCRTHIVPRLRAVVDGTDQGGVSKALGWKGGGGFRYFEVTPTEDVEDTVPPVTRSKPMDPMIDTGTDVDSFLESYPGFFDEAAPMRKGGCRKGRG